jgi:sugar phosphate isomerase/epimerase
MDIGASTGPYVERITSLPSVFQFAEVAIGESELPLAALDTDQLSERLDRHDLSAVVHLPYRQPLATPVDRIDAATMAYLDDVLAAAASLGAHTAVAHPSARGAGHETDRLTDQMAELVASGQSHDITVCFETVGYAGGIGLDRLGELAAQADSAICLDVGYAYLEAGTDGVTEFLDSYGDLVEHLHVHGARHRGDTHIPVGSGDVAYDAIGSALAETVSDATATIEVFTADPEYLAASAQRFRAAVGVEPEADESA